MINGVLLIVAAVLFAVLYLLEGLGIMWLWVAGFYLVAGILDLITHFVKEKVKIHSANKKAVKAENEKKQAQDAKKQIEDAKRIAEEAKNLIAEPKQEVTNG